MGTAWAQREAVLLTKLRSKASLPGPFPHPRPQGNIWQRPETFLDITRGVLLLLASSGQRLGTLLNIPECPGERPHEGLSDTKGQQHRWGEICAVLTGLSKTELSTSSTCMERKGDEWEA